MWVSFKGVKQCVGHMMQQTREGPNSDTSRV